MYTFQMIISKRLTLLLRRLEFLVFCAFLDGVVWDNQSVL